MIIGSSYSDFHEILQLKNDTKIELMMAMQKTIRASERVGPFASCLKCIAWLLLAAHEGNCLLPTNFLKLLKPFRLSTVLLCSLSIPKRSPIKMMQSLMLNPFFPFCTNPISQPFNLYLFPSSSTQSSVKRRRNKS